MTNLDYETNYYITSAMSPGEASLPQKEDSFPTVTDIEGRIHCSTHQEKEMGL